jgi:hypothetical protein
MTDPKNDSRISRSIWFTDEIGEYSIEILPHEKIIWKDKKIEFIKPNTVSLSLSISNKELLRAKGVFKTKIEPILFDGLKLRVKNIELQTLYDYLEAIQTSLIFSYNAVEAFSNISIPNSFTYEKTNQKGVKESWNKENIERWMSTSDKLNEIIPLVLNCDKPNKFPFWSNFTILEKIRNNIIHPKTSELLYKESQSHYEEFLKEEIFTTIQSGYKIIEHFCTIDKENILYPAEYWDKVERTYKVKSFADLKFLNRDP